MVVARRSAPSASPPSSLIVVEIPSRPLTNEVLEEEFGTKDDIASAQAKISLAMSMDDLFEFSTEFSIPIVPDF